MLTPIHQYWPLTGWVEYLCYEIEGYYHSDTMALDVGKRVPLPSRDIRRTYIPLGPDAFCSGVAMPETPRGQKPPTDWYDTCNDALVTGMERKGDGSGWLGELGNLRDWYETPREWTGIQLPVLPQLPLRETDYLEPITGDISLTRTNKRTGETRHENGSWKFRNLGIKEWWWPEYGPTWRTALHENPGKPGGRYNYLFAKNIGLVDIWWINADETGHGSGWEWQAVVTSPV